MNIKRFEMSKDYDRVINFLTDEYRKNKNMICWLPARFDDLIFRIDTLYHDERGLKKSQDYTYIFEENNDIAGIVVPDGDSFNSCIKTGYEEIFPKMLDLSEKELLPLLERKEDGSIDFLVISHDSLQYQAEELTKRGYVKDAARDYDNVQHTMKTHYSIELPEGYQQVYGEQFEDNRKAKACHYGFHPADDDGILTGTFKEGALAYQGRKKSRYYPDSFESLIITADGDICAYSFCYVDRVINTAYIEPVCTREKYRKKGLAKQMLYGIINRLKERKIENCYINSYDWRKKVYHAAGFKTEASIGFWHKNIM